MSGQPETDDPKVAPYAEAAKLGEDDAATGPTANPTGDGERRAISTEELLAELEKERLRQDTMIADLKDRLMRTYADMENLRKRTEKERADTAKYAISKFAADIVGMADNLQRALEAAGDPDALSDDVKGIYEGVALTAQELAKSLEKNGIRKIEALGAVFDPHMHQAMMEQPKPDVPSGTILQVFQDGYIIGDRVLRPAMVVVARGGAKPQREPAGDAGGPKASNDSGPQTEDGSSAA